MHKANQILQILISAALITATYFYLSYGIFIVATSLSWSSALMSAREIMEFFCILVGVALDRLTQKLKLRDRLIAVACVVIIPGLILKFLI